MPLPLPNLDDRRWDDLVEEGRSLIPRYAPGWSDHNVHDPGVMLLELFAWLTEMDIYRLNQVPDRHRLKFLSLIGCRPRPPQAARAVLVFDPGAGFIPLQIPAGIEFLGQNADGRQVPFRTLRELRISHTRLDAIVVDAGDGAIRDVTGEWRDGLPIALFGKSPTAGATFYLGFSALSSDIPLSLGFHFQGPGSDANERLRIEQESAERRAACEPVSPGIDCDDGAGVAVMEPPALLRYHSANVRWQVFTGDVSDPWKDLQPVSGAALPASGEVRDDTRSLTLDGFLELNPPSAIVTTPLGPLNTPLFWVRCTLTSGAYDDRPLALAIEPNAVLCEQAVPIYQKLTIPAGLTALGTAPVSGDRVALDFQLDSHGELSSLTFVDPLASPDYPTFLVLDYVPAGAGGGHLTIAFEIAAVGAGMPGQISNLSTAPLQEETLKLYSHQNGAWQLWERRDTFDASARSDFHYTLDATSGRILFGSGDRGRAPAEGAILVASFKSTLAAAGNVNAGSVSALAGSAANIPWLTTLPDPVQTESDLSTITTNPIPAAGGMAAEDLSNSTGRAVAEQHAHERIQELLSEARSVSLDEIDGERVRALPAPTRAVNLPDIERLALDVPGTKVARARAWSAVHPAYPCLQTPGVITVVILPKLSVARPRPSAGLLAAVRRYLDRRRIITTRLEITGPTYIEVVAQAKVRAREHTNISRIEEAVREVLEAYLDPLRGGPDGRGWPFGRDVYRSEIMELIDGVPGVDHVLELSLQADGGEPQCGNIALCPTWLVSSGAHQIKVLRGNDVF